jgi:dihydropteroate synthase
MAILNITPDSFYDGGSYQNEKKVLQKVEQFITEGADIIDIGAYSSRPGAIHISLEEEKSRLLPVLKTINTHFPKITLSIDTFRSEIAKISLEEGAEMINDISGGELDSKMFELIAHYKVPYVIMHMRGNPQNMQKNISEGEIVEEVENYFKNKLQILSNIGVNNVILDVGFGFGKSLNQNFDLLRNLSKFKDFEKPLLVGISRKSMLYKTLETTPDKVLNATSVVHTLALLNGASILRVHDVQEAKEVVTILNKYFN